MIMEPVVKKVGIVSKSIKEKNMSEQQTPLTYQGVLEMFRESDRKFQQMVQENNQRQKETDRRMKETAEQMKETDRMFQQMVQDNAQHNAQRQKEMDRLERLAKETEKKISALGSRIGEIVENMIGGDIVPQFREFGYAIQRYGRNLIFGDAGTAESGEIDLFLEDGDVAILIEVKTNLKTADVLEHIERLEKYRRSIDVSGNNHRRFIGAVAGAVVEKNVADFAQKHGMYVIVQSGRAVEIITPPEGFVPKQW